MSDDTIARPHLDAFGNTWHHRLRLRLLGICVLISSDRPVHGLRTYYGSYTGIGRWITMAAVNRPMWVDTPETYRDGVSNAVTPLQLVK